MLLESFGGKPNPSKFQDFFWWQKSSSTPHFFFLHSLPVDVAGLCVALRSISGRTQQLEVKVTTKSKARHGDGENHGKSQWKVMAKNGLSMGFHMIYPSMMV